MTSDRVRVGDRELKFSSITFEGARVSVVPKDDDIMDRSASPAQLVFRVGDMSVKRPVPAVGDAFISFADFGFSGFKDAKVSISILETPGGTESELGTVPIYRVPLVPFFRNLQPDHHDSFFFLQSCGQSAVYGRLSEQGFPTKGVFLISVDADQSSALGPIAAAPSDVLEALRARQALLYIDQSHEGNAFDAEFAERTHALLESLKIDADLVFFANHTWNYRRLYEAWAKERGLLKTLNIIYSHWYADGLMFHERDYFGTYGGIDEFVRLQRFRAFSGFVRPKKFFAMNYTPRAHRVLLMLKLLQKGYLESGIVSFGGLRNSDKYKKNYFEMAGEGFITGIGFQDLLEFLPQLEALGTLSVDRPFKAGVEGEAIRLSATMSQEPYDDSYFSVVTESEMLYESSFQRVTEKVYKPILRLHPFLVLGNFDTMGLLKDQGYRSFDGFFNESYDKEIRADARAKAMFAELDRVMALPMNELAEAYRKVWPALEHNLYTANDYMTTGLKRGKQQILMRLYEKLRSLDA